MAETDTRKRDSRYHLFPRGSLRGTSYRGQCEEGPSLLQALQHQARFHRTPGTDNIGDRRRSSLGSRSEPTGRVDRGLSARTLHCKKRWTNPLKAIHASIREIPNHVFALVPWLGNLILYWE